MKKIVSESLVEYRDKNNLNEGVFDAIGKGISSAAGAIKGLFQKIGKFFFANVDGEAIPVNVPANVGIMVKDGDINKKVINYLASKEDVKMDPQLASLNEANFMKRFQEQEAQEDAKERADADKWADEMISKLQSGGKIAESYLKKMKQKAIKEAMLPLEHPDKKSRIKDVNRSTLLKLITTIMEYPDESLMVWGAPGIGKTKIVNACVKATGGRMIDVQTSKMRNDDWSLPYMAYEDYEGGGEEENWKQTVQANDPEAFKGKGTAKKSGILQKVKRMVAKDIAKEWIPGYVPTGNKEVDKKLDDAANGTHGGAIFLDELNRAYPEVQASCFKLVDERIIGNVVLGSKWAIIAAGNRPGDDPFISADDWSAILSDRFVNVNFVPTFAEWKEWAYQNKIDDRIMTFLEFNPQFFYHWDDESLVNATPRGWHRASRFIQKFQKAQEKMGNRFSFRDAVEVFEILLGTQIGTEIGVFLRVMEQFSPEDLKMVMTDPEKAALPAKKAVGEVAGFLAAVINQTKGKRLTAEEFKNYCIYLTRIDNSSIAGAALQRMVKAHPYINKGVGDEIAFTNKMKGETTASDEFLEGVKIFEDKYKDFF